MRVLVIGGHGFLGGHIRRRLAADGWDVVAAGRTPRPGCVRLDLSVDRVTQVAKRLVEVAPDAVVNCAGAIAGDPAALAAANVTGPATLLEGLVLAGAGPRLVHLGSAAEYGEVETGIPVREQAPTRPVSAYGATKLAGTRLVRLARATGLDAVVLRVFNTVGPGSPATSLPGRIAGELARALAEDGAVRLGPLDVVRDFVDPRDVADAVHAALTVGALDHPVLNVGSGTAVPTRALVDELLAITGFTGAVRCDAAGSPRSGAVPWQQADIAATRTALGWRPRRDLTTSLGDLWKTLS
ncbi:NAD-dependent epimerase/dehydratase family protein [Planosporangium mesophilum]|uniref:NAD-dependent epimerase/dehydratase family protein n=1 Tax=Planosporangium mesophilum TaxID=689768 RepID=UPI001439D27B|nr:NAD(P)-dependent oxidoreductase [Planosporangium mesophilum]NJC85436.1 NAD(P)-dependent oxidoreductase [Planosporangium mesophilum]